MPKQIVATTVGIKKHFAIMQWLYGFSSAIQSVREQLSADDVILLNTHKKQIKDKIKWFETQCEEKCLSIREKHAKKMELDRKELRKKFTQKQEIIYTGPVYIVGNSLFDVTYSSFDEILSDIGIKATEIVEKNLISDPSNHETTVAFVNDSGQEKAYKIESKSFVGKRSGIAMLKFYAKEI